MPLAAAEGGITLAEEHLRLTVADCARFRTWALNAPDQAAALARIYIDGLPLPPEGQDAYTLEQMQALRPFAIVTTANQAGYSKGRIATATYAEVGKLAVAFEENVPANLARDIAAVERSFKNTLGTILDQMLGLAYTAPDADRQYLAIDLITFHGPLRCTQDVAVAEGDHHFAYFEVQYGVGVR
jgi:hypothetical protein